MQDEDGRGSEEGVSRSRSYVSSLPISTVGYVA